MMSKRLQMFFIILATVLIVTCSVVWLRKPDDFFTAMTRSDLAARSSTSIRAYHAYYKNTIREAPLLYMSLKKAADGILADYPKLHAIKWKLKTIDVTIENGYPHTLGDTIYLPERILRDFDVETLVHEKIHIYQRQYKSETRELINLWGFKPTDYKHPLQRNNPDLDGINYRLGDQVVYQRYNSSDPKNLADSKTVTYDLKTQTTTFVPSASYLGFPSFVMQLEHPYEIMACMLAKVIIEPDILMKHEKNKKLEDLMSFVNKHMRTY
jgi:hypothetical protein